MNDHAISGLANPTRPNDAVHKFYVDSLFENLQTAVDAQITQYQREMETFRPVSSDSHNYHSRNQRNQPNEENKFSVILNVLCYA